MKHEEMITLIGNMFINAYVAGGRKDLDSFRSARADRDHLFDVIKELYAELEHESYEREQFENELKEADEKIKAHKLELNRLNEEIEMRIAEKRAIFCGNPPTIGMKRRLSEIYGEKIEHVDDRSLYPSKDDSIPDDADSNLMIYDDAVKFSEQDLPFPDVEEMVSVKERGED